MDLDTRNLIDVQVAMADPSAKKIRGQGFSQADRTKVKGHMRRIIEQHIIPSTQKKIRILDDSVTKTRKGLKNSISNFFKKPERGENDGLKDGFRMNK